MRVSFGKIYVFIVICLAVLRTINPNNYFILEIQKERNNRILIESFSCRLIVHDVPPMLIGCKYGINLLRLSRQGFRLVYVIE